MAYRADIEIAVRGASQITNLKTQIESLSAGVIRLNKSLSTGTVASVDNFTKLVSQSERVLRSAAQGTDVQRKAIDAYIRSVAAAEKAEKSLQTAIAGRRRELGIAAPTAAGGQARGGRLGGAISNAAIGAAFPLLFGQSGAAAAGGAIGGIAGSALGPTGGFAGSLVGTLIGEKLGQANKVKELAADIGFSAEQTKLLGVAFQQAGRDFDKFQTSVSTIQGLSLSIEDQARAIQLASTLTENYGGKIDKVTNAFANALSTGKVTQGTLNQLTKENIPIQEALANKYNISRSELLQYAKDGKISVQDLIDTLVEVGNKGTTAANAQRDAFADSFDQINTALSNFQTTATDAFKSTADALRVDLGGAIQAVTGYTIDFINGLSELTRIAGPALDAILSAYINIEKAIFNAVGAVPALRDAIVSFALTALGPLQGVARLIDSIRGVGAATKGPEKQGPYVPERLKRKPLESFFAPSQAAPSGGSSAADKAAREAARLAEQTKKQIDDAFKLNTLAAVNLDLQLSANDAERIKAEYDKAGVERRTKFVELLKNSKSETERQLLLSAQLSEIAIADNKYNKDKQDLLKQQLKPLQDIIDSNKQKFEDDKAYQRLVAEGINPELAKQYVEIDRAGKALQEALQPSIDLAKSAITEAEARGASADEVARLKKELKDLEDLPGKKVDEAKKSIVPPTPKTPVDTIKGRVDELKKEIAELTNLGNIAVTVADGIGNAFGNAFKSLIDGSQSAREVLAGFFSDVASLFLEMAAQIIAKQITMLILQTLLKALGAVSGGASGGSNNYSGAFGAGGPTFNPGAFSMPALAKNGAYFSNNIAKFASGGIVGAPMLFKYADGGTTKTGLMGEAGPEAIMPLRRNSSGQLGVSASGLRDAMGRAPGTSGFTMINMSFETTKFGNTEYVSREQLEAAMIQTRRQAASDGAKRGMNMTIDRLQQSPQTRSRVGLR